MKKIVFVFMAVISSVVFSSVFADGLTDGLERASGYPEFSILEAVYDCTAKGGIINSQVKYKIRIWEDKSVRVPVLSDEVAISKADLPKDVLLVAGRGWYNLIFPKKGEYRVAINFISKIKEIENKNIFTLKPSPAVVSKLNLLIPGTDLDVEVNPSLSMQTEKLRDKNTRLVAFLGNTRELKVSWTLQPSAVAAIRPMFLSRNNRIVVISQGIIRTTSILNYEVMQGKLSKFQINLPVDSNLLTVKGKNIQNWDLKQQKDKQILEVELSEAITDFYELTLEMEETKDASPGVYRLPEISSSGMERQSGYIAILVKDNLKVQPVKSAGVSQIDVDELPKRFKTTASGRISLAYRYLKQPIELNLNIEKITPEIIARNNIFIHVDEELITFYMLVDYDIHKVGVFNFNLELPADFTLIDVKGKALKDWRVEKNNQSQKLEVMVKNRILGKYQLFVKMEKPVKDILAGVEVPRVKVCDAKRETGYIGISSAGNIKLITENRTNIAEVDIEELITLPKSIDVIPMLAYKYIEHPYELKLAVEEVEARVTSEVFTFLSVGEGLLLVDSAITYNILYTGIDEFTIVFPEEVQVMDITGENIKSKQEYIEEREVNGKKIKEKIWKVNLHSKVKGVYTLYCSYEQLAKEVSGTIELPKLQVLDVQREIGYWCLGPRTNVEIKSNTITAVTQIDIDELPKDKTESIDIPLVLAYRYVKHPYDISIDVKKHKDVSVLVAIVESANITSVLTKEGQVIINALYKIKNKQKQYLDILLPENANIWSVFVNNKPVKPSRTDEGHILVPLEKFKDENALFPVEIIYETKRPKLKIVGRLKMLQPQLDIPLTNVTWQLYLPDEFNYGRFRGNLEIAKANAGRRSNGSQFGIVDSASNAMPHRNASGKGSKSSRQKSFKRQFQYNVASQYTRYQQHLEQSKGAVKQVEQGKLVGALPIRVSIPTGGKLITFKKLFSSSELLVVNAVYAKGVSAIFSLIAGIMILAVIAFNLISRRMKSDLSL